MKEKKLIAILKDLTPYCQHPDKMAQFIAALNKATEKLEVNKQIGAKRNEVDNRAASWVVIAVTLFPELMVMPDPNKGSEYNKYKALQDYVRGLTPTEISVPAGILPAFHHEDVAKKFRIK